MKNFKLYVWSFLAIAVGISLGLSLQSPSQVDWSQNPKLREVASVTPNTRLRKPLAPLNLEILDAGNLGDIQMGTTFKVRVRLTTAQAFPAVRIRWILPETGVNLLRGHNEFSLTNLEAGQVHEFETEFENLSTNNRTLIVVANEDTGNGQSGNQLGATTSFATIPSQTPEAGLRLPTAEEKYEAHGIKLNKAQADYLNQKSSKPVH